MSLRPLNSVGGFSVGETPVNIILANGDITTTSIIVSGTSNLGPISNVTITGGINGYYLKTDGSGGLSWAAVPTGTNISNGTSNVDIPISSGNVVVYAGGNNTINITSTGANITGTLNVTGNANVGNIGATNGIFTNVSGNGSALSSITGANVTGAVAYATTANSVAGANVSGEVNYAAVANSVAGANVSGAVNLSTYATTANSVAGANVSGQVSYAAVANSVAGANVSGAVNLATYASTANAVAGANVSGQVNYAAVANSVAGANVTGAVAYATTANSVAGANVTGAVAYATTANSVAGANVSGEVGFAAIANSVAGANITGQVANALVAGTVTTAAQPNITSVGTLTSVAVTGNVTAGNVYANSGTIGTGILNVSGKSNLNAVGNVTITGGTSGQYLQTDGSGNLSWQTINTSEVSNGTSNVSITSSGGNVNTSVAGNANVFVVTGTGVNVAGTLNSTGNANVGNLGTAQVLASANITAPQLISNISTGTAPLVVSSTTKVTNLNADLLDGLDSATSATASTIVARDANANIAANNISGTLTTASQTNITAVGTLGSLAVTGNVTAGNVYANSGTIGASLVAGTLTTAAQPNITSVGTLSSLAVTANVAAGNLTTGGVLNVTGTSQSSIAGNLAMNSKNITGLADPVNAQDAATKNYVDTVAQGLHVHDSCYVATTGTLAAASGGTVTYNNGSSGVGATLTTTGTYLLIDGGNVQTSGTRILVKNEANAAWNGIYTYTSTTVLTRATDFDTTADAAGGDFVFVTSGSTQADTGWVQTTDNPTLGTSDIVWQQFSGAGTYSAGTGLTLTGTTFSITNTAVTAASYGNSDRVASFTVNQQGQLTAASNVVIAANAANLTGTTLASGIITSSLTSVGTITTGIWNNNIGSSATFAAGLSGANLSSITGANVSGQVSYAAVANSVAGANVSGAVTYATTANSVAGANVTGQVANALVAGTVYTAAQPNITSVGTLSSLTVTNKVTAGQLQGDGGNISNIQGANVSGAVSSATTAGTVTTAAQPNITSVGSLTSLTVTGTATAGNLSTAGNITGANITSNSKVTIGNTTINWAQVTTTATTANQTISTVSVTGITGVEWLVKGSDSSSSKYSIATVHAVTDGANVDWSIYGGATLGSTTGTLSVGISSGNIVLQVTPSSANSTVWVTQYKYI